MSKGLAALVLLSGCVKHFDIDIVYRERRVEGVYRVLQDQYDGCLVTFRPNRLKGTLIEYNVDRKFYDSLEDEWCE
jgi:hypothetical protein